MTMIMMSMIRIEVMLVITITVIIFIIMIIFAFLGSPGQATYSATKFAIQVCYIKCHNLNLEKCFEDLSLLVTFPLTIKTMASYFSRGILTLCEWR